MEDVERLCPRSPRVQTPARDLRGFGDRCPDAYSWVHRPNKTWPKGAQIDLLLDRPDNTINLIEIKFSNEPFTITKSYAESRNPQPSAPEGCRPVLDAGILEEPLREDRVLPLQNHRILTLRETGSILPARRGFLRVPCLPVKGLFLIHATKK